MDCPRPPSTLFFGEWTYCELCGARNDAPCPQASEICALMNARAPGDMPSPTEFRLAWDADFQKRRTPMFEKLKAKVAAFFAWVIEWVTVLASVLVGLPAILFEALDSLSGTDLTPLLPAGQAAKIITAIAIMKAVYAARKSRAT